MNPLHIVFVSLFVNYQVVSFQRHFKNSNKYPKKYNYEKKHNAKYKQSSNKSKNKNVNKSNGNRGNNQFLTRNEEDNFKIFKNTNLYLLKDNLQNMTFADIESALVKTNLFKSKHHIKYILKELENTDYDKIFIHNDTLERNEFYMMLLLRNDPIIETKIIDLSS